MLVIDAICPLYKADKYIDRLISNFQAQKNIEIHPIFPITKSDDDENVIQKIKNAGYKYFLVESEDFSHSLTRQKAMYEYCSEKLVLFISQDVNMLDENAVYELAKSVEGDVVYAFGKQICRKKTIEHYTRMKNYGEESYVFSSKDIETHQLLTFFGSDAFAVYNRDIFLELNGYDGEDMMMSEDMYYIKKIMDAGYKKAYVASAVVEHYHTMSLKQIYKRYYDSGKWFAAHPEFNQYKATDSGMKMALFVLGHAIKDFNLPVVFQWLPNMAARYLGMRQGRRIGVHERSIDSRSTGDNLPDQGRDK